MGTEPLEGADVYEAPVGPSFPPGGQVEFPPVSSGLGVHVGVIGDLEAHRDSMGVEAVVQPTVVQAIDRGSRIASKVEDADPGIWKQAAQERDSVRVTRGLQYQGVAHNCSAVAGNHGAMVMKGGSSTKYGPGGPLGIGISGKAARTIDCGKS